MNRVPAWTWGHANSSSRSLGQLAADWRVRAILFVTHHVEEIPARFSHVLLLRGGRVIGAGPISEVLTGDALTACFGMPLAIGRGTGRWAARAADGAPARQAGGRWAARVPRTPDDQGRGARSLVRDPDGRMKAFRPVPAPARLEALARGLAAYAAGDFFDAHEILEPAWMGTDDPAERALYQGLIKLAAAGMHAVRGNPEGVRRNLLGAASRFPARVPTTADGALGNLVLRSVDLVATRTWVTAALDALDAVPLEEAPAGTDAGGAALPLMRVTRLLAVAPAPVRLNGGVVEGLVSRARSRLRLADGLGEDLVGGLDPRER